MTIREVIEKHRWHLEAIPNVIGIAPSEYRQKGQKHYPEQVIKVYVKGHKIEAALLNPSELIPPELDGIKTDVVCFPNGIKPRTLKGGESPPPVGRPTNIDETSYPYFSGGMAVSGQKLKDEGALGTSGLVVRLSRADPTAYYGVSNGHVDPVLGEKFYQMTYYRGDNVILVYPPNGQSQGDFSAQRLASDANPQQTVIQLGTYETTYHAPTPGMSITKRGVTKYGESDYLTTGTIIAGPTSIQCSYDEGTFTVKNVYDAVGPNVNHPFSGAGCSGSMIFSVENGAKYPCGQLFAGGLDDKGVDHTFLFDWQAAGILDTYGVSFDLSAVPNQPPVTPPPQQPPSNSFFRFLKWLRHFLGFN